MAMTPAERKRKQRERRKNLSITDRMSLPEVNITISIRAHVALQEMTREIGCTISEVIEALTFIDMVANDDFSYPTPVEFMRAAVAKSRNIYAKWAEEDKAERKAQALLKTYKATDL